MQIVKFFLPAVNLLIGCSVRVCAYFVVGPVKGPYKLSSMSFFPQLYNIGVYPSDHSLSAASRVSAHPTLLVSRPLIFFLLVPLYTSLYPLNFSVLSGDITGSVGRQGFHRYSKTWKYSVVEKLFFSSSLCLCEHGHQNCIWLGILCRCIQFPEPQ